MLYLLVNAVAVVATVLPFVVGWAADDEPKKPGTEIPGRDDGKPRPRDPVTTTRSSTNEHLVRQTRPERPRMSRLSDRLEQGTIDDDAAASERCGV